MTAKRARADAMALLLQLPRALSPIASQTPLSATLREALEASVKKVLLRFGIPGEPSVTISAQGEDVTVGAKLLRLTVDGRLVRYPDELLRQAYCYVNDQLLDPAATPTSIEAWLKDCCEGAHDTDADPRIVEFFCLTCAKVLEREPAVLFGLAQAQCYAATLGGPAGGLDVEWLRSILRQVLDLRISIARQQVVADVLAKAFRDEKASTTVVEDLITALRRDTVDIRMAKPTLRALTSRWLADGPKMFSFLRTGLFEELGLRIPDLRFVPVDDLKPGSFSFRVNEFVSMPLVGLSADQLLVNDTAERLRLSGYEAVATASPATGQPNAVVGVDCDERAKQRGLTTWNQIAHLILCLAEFLRRNGWCAVHHAGVEEQLEKLEAAFPALTTAARSNGTNKITRLLRGLIREGVSVQNLRAILERLLDHRFAAAPETPLESSDASGSADLHAFVRSALGPAITYKAAARTNTVVVYLFDAEIEQMPAEPVTEGDERGDRILRAVRKEFESLPPTALVPSFLTFSKSRAALQRLLTAEYPRVAVIAHEELPPGTNVQPVARIAM